MTNWRVSGGKGEPFFQAERDTMQVSNNVRYFAFTTEMVAIVPGDTNLSSDIFILDTSTRTTKRISVDKNGVQGNNTSSEVSISADGKYVVFTSRATNLAQTDINALSDIFLYSQTSNNIKQITNLSKKGFEAISGEITDNGS
ncbi:MAG: hypothetical protein SGJ17_04075 [Hyphomicrobiales bacterium]|nr:hypothetical protein [Hyphomicrobiales bacterium]